MPGVFLQPAPPKWTTVVSTGSAQKSAQRRSKICTGFESVSRISEIFDVYRSECTRLGMQASSDQLAIRRNISISRDAAEAREEANAAKEAALKVVAGDPRVVKHASSCSMHREPAPDFHCMTMIISRARRRKSPNRSSINAANAVRAIFSRCWAGAFRRVAANRSPSLARK